MSYYERITKYNHICMRCTNILVVLMQCKLQILFPLCKSQWFLDIGYLWIINLLFSGSAVALFRTCFDELLITEVVFMLQSYCLNVNLAYLVPSAYLVPKVHLLRYSYNYVHIFLFVVFELLQNIFSSLKLDSLISCIFFSKDR